MTDTLPSADSVVAFFETMSPVTVTHLSAEAANETMSQPTPVPEAVHQPKRVVLIWDTPDTAFRVVPSHPAPHTVVQHQVRVFSDPVPVVVSEPIAAAEPETIEAETIAGLPELPEGDWSIPTETAMFQSVADDPDDLAALAPPSDNVLQLFTPVESSIQEAFDPEFSMDYTASTAVPTYEQSLDIAPAIPEGESSEQELAEAWDSLTDISAPEVIETASTPDVDRVITRLGFGANSVDIVSSHPMVDEINLLLLQHQGQYFLVADTPEDAQTIKTFDANPLAIDAQSYVEEEVVLPNKHLFMAKFGLWEGIIALEGNTVKVQAEL